MIELTKISDAPYGSKIRFELDGETLTGHNWRDVHDLDKVHVFEPAPSRTVELPPDKEVEVLERGGFQSDVSEVRVL